MKRLLVAMAMLCVSLAAVGQNAAVNGFCTAGGKPAKTQGAFATNFQQEIIPSCTVTVYLTGTLTLATLYTNIGGAPLANPFTANAVGSAAPGQWLFYTLTGTGVDIVLSGGIAPNTFPTPVTLTGVIVGGGGGGSFNPLVKDAISGPTGGMTEVVGLLSNLLPTLTPGFLNWTGSAWVFSPGTGAANPAGSPCQVQLNLANVFGVDTTLCDNPTTHTLNQTNILGLVTNGVFQTAAYGAVPDGKICPVSIGSSCTYSGTDNTTFIQNAINAACAVGGGEVDIPGGTFNVATTPGAPRQTGLTSFQNIAAIIIPCSNITLKGAGIDQTTLSVWMNSSGTYTRVTDACPANPDFSVTPSGSWNSGTTYSAGTIVVNGAYYFVSLQSGNTNNTPVPLIATAWWAPRTYPRTYRGSGIYVAALDTPGAVTTNVQIRDLTLFGNAVINGNNFNPVRQDPVNSPTPFWSQCNGWDTSNKGIYFQNDDFAPLPSNGAFYNGCTNCAFSNITIDHVAVHNFLGELIYSGNPTGMTISNDDLQWSNGDAVSVGSNPLVETNNNIANLSASGNENEVEGPQTYQNNTFTNTQLDGIGTINEILASEGPNPVYPQINILGNIFLNNMRSAIHPFSPVHVKIVGNQIKDSAWPAFFSSPIALFAQTQGTASSWLPAGPSPSTPTSGGSGSIPAGTYSVAETWQIAALYTNAQTVTGTCFTLVVGSSSSTITIPAPTGAPSNATGWYAYIGATCTQPTLFLQGGFTANALGSPLTVSALASVVNPPTPPGFTYEPGIIDTDVNTNTITADTVTLNNGVSFGGTTSSFVPVGVIQSTAHDNHVSLTTQYNAAAINAPAHAPIVTSQTGPPYTYAPQPVLPANTYYVEYEWVNPTCPSAPSPQTSIMVGSGQQINVTPNPLDTPPLNTTGYYVLMSTTSGTGFTKQTNYADPYTILANTFVQQYALLNNQGNPDTGCSGTSVQQPIGYGFTAAQTNAYSEFGNTGNNTIYGATELQTSAINGVPLASTSATQLAFYRPSHPRWATASINYQIVNAPSNIVIQLVWADFANSFHTLTLENVTAQAVGLYQLSPLDIPVGQSSIDYVTATCGTANNCLVNAQITDKGQN